MRSEVLLALSLVQFCFSCHPFSADEENRCDGQVEADNARLPMGTDVAVIITGIFIGGVTDSHALPSLVNNVINPLEHADVDGSDVQRGNGQVHVFVHTEVMNDSKRTAHDLVEKTLHSQLGHHLKGLILKHAGQTIWAPPALMETRTWNLKQMPPLREIFEMVLGYELHLGQRYSHVLRVRSDTIFLVPWRSLQHPDSLVQRVKQGTVAGPMYSQQRLFPYLLRSVPLGPAPGVMNDQFWICSRATAWQVMVMFPFLLWNPPNANQMSHMMGCPLYGQRLASDALANRSVPSDELSKAADDLQEPFLACESDGRTQGCHETVDTLMVQERMHGLARIHAKRCASHLNISEALFTYFLRTSFGIHNLVESCDITGPFVVNNAHTTFNRPCLYWDGLNGEKDYMPHVDDVLEDLHTHIQEGDIERRPLWEKERARGFLAESTRFPGWGDGVAQAGKPLSGSMGGAWRENESLAHEDTRAFYNEAILGVKRYNRYGNNAWAFDRTEGNTSVLDVSAYVICHLTVRCSAVEGMLRLAGFSRVEFADTQSGDSIDLSELVRSGKVSTNFSKGVGLQRRKYVAHALDYKRILDQVIQNANEGWIGIFEDDLILTTTPRKAFSRIEGALHSLPEDADTLHLEYCYDLCEAARFESSNPYISTAANPFCAAAILFSAKGVRKMSKILETLGTSVDDMVAESCQKETLHCFKLRHPVYAQDFYWGSTISPSSYWVKDSSHHEENKHELYLDVPLCRDYELEFDVEDDLYAPPRSSLPVRQLSGKQQRHPQDKLVAMRLIKTFWPPTMTVHVGGLAKQCMYDLVFRITRNGNVVFGEDRVIVLEAGHTSVSVDFTVNIDEVAVAEEERGRDARALTGGYAVEAAVLDSYPHLESEDDILGVLIRNI